MDSRIIPVLRELGKIMDSRMMTRLGCWIFDKIIWDRIVEKGAPGGWKKPRKAGKGTKGEEPRRAFCRIIYSRMIPVLWGWLRWFFNRGFRG